MSQMGDRHGEGGLRLEEVAKTFRQGGEALKILDRVSLQVAPGDTLPPRKKTGRSKTRSVN